MSNITSGSNLIVSNDATIGNNLYVSKQATVANISTTTASVTNLTNTNATINKLTVNNVDVNGSLKVLGVDLIEYLDNNNSNSNISYESGITTISGNTHINNLTTGSIDTNILKVNGSNIVDTITNDYTSYVDTKISNLIGGAPASLDTLKELSDLLNSDTITQSVVSSISGINSSITTLTSNVNTLQTNDILQSNVNSSLSNSINTINATVSGLDAKLLTVGNSTTFNTNNITTLTNQYNNLDSKVNTLSTSSQNTLTALNTEIDNLDAIYAQKLTNFSYSNNKTRINDLYTDNLEIGNHKHSIDTATDEYNIKPSNNNSNSSYNIYTTNATGVQTKKITVNNNGLLIDNMNVKSAISNLQTDNITNKANITTLQTATTGITYNTTGNLTTIDNNINISSGKNLILGSTNIMTSLTNISDDLTGISYNSTGDVTTIDNNVTISSGKDLVIGSTNVKTSIDNINHTLSGITYGGASDDVTYINNHVILPNANSLYLGDVTYNVKNKIEARALLTGDNAFSGTNTFQSDTIPIKITTKNNPTLNNALTVLYASADDQINDMVQLNDIIMYTGSSINSAKSGLFIGPWANGGNKGIRISPSKFEVGPGLIETPAHQIDASTNTMTLKPQGINGSIELYTTGSDATQKTKRFAVNNSGTYTYDYTSLNNGNLVLLNGNTFSYRGITMKNTAFLLENSSGVSSQMYQNGATMHFDNGYINGSRTNFNNRTPSTTDASGNIVDGTSKLVLSLDSNGGTLFGNLSVGNELTSTGTTSLCNGAFRVLSGNVECYRNLGVMGGGSILSMNSTGSWTKMNFDNNGLFDTYAIKPSSKIQFRVQDASGNSITALQMNSSGVSIAGNLYSDSLNAFANIADLTISNSQTAGTSSGSSHSSLVASVTLNRQLKKQIKFISPISFYRSVLLTPAPTTTNIADKEIKTTITNINIQVRKNGILEPASISSFSFNEETPRVITAYKVTNFTPSPTSYNLNFYIGTLNLTHDISGEAGDVFTYYITANIVTVTKYDNDVFECLYTNTTTQTVSNTSFVAVTQNFSQNYYSPSYSLSVSKSNMPATGLIQSNELSANEIGANKLNVNTGYFNSIINKGYINSNYIKTPSNIAGYMFNGNNVGYNDLIPTPILCSMKYFGPGNVDDVYVINPGYKVLLFDNPDYSTWDPSNINSQLSAYPNTYWEIINDGDAPKVVGVPPPKLNKTESIVVYYRPSIDDPYTLIWYPYLSYTP